MIKEDTTYCGVAERLPNGMIIEAYSEPARQEMNPLAVVDALEKEWKNERP